MNVLERLFFLKKNKAQSKSNFPFLPKFFSLMHLALNFKIHSPF